MPRWATLFHCGGCTEWCPFLRHLQSPSIGVKCTNETALPADGCERKWGWRMGGCKETQLVTKRIAVDTSAYLMYRKTVHAYCPHTRQGNKRPTALTPERETINRPTPLTPERETRGLLPSHPKGKQLIGLLPSHPKGKQLILLFCSVHSLR